MVVVVMVVVVMVVVVMVVGEIKNTMARCRLGPQSQT